jgi:uncharacterized protein
MRLAAAAVVFFAASHLESQDSPLPPPVIDMHLHAHTLSMYGAPPPAVCTNDQDIVFPGLDPRKPID